MAVVGVDKSNLQFVAPRDLRGEARVAWNVQADHRHNVRKQFCNLKTAPARPIDRALWVSVNCIDPARPISSMPAMESGRNNARRKASQSPNFDDTSRCHNTDQRGKKKMITWPDRPRIIFPALRD